MIRQNKKNYLTLFNKLDFNSFKYEEGWHLARRWYYREKLYENLIHGVKFKNFTVDNQERYTRLIPISKNKYNLLLSRDFHKEESSNNHIKIENEITSQLENFNSSSKIDDEIEDNNNIKVKQSEKVGVFWLFGGDNRKRLIDHLFEYNNFLPSNDKYYYLHVQQAPLNPMTFEDHVIEHNYFNILNYPDFTGQRMINKKEIDVMKDDILSHLYTFIEDYKLDKVVIGGFSQGGSMALYVGLTDNEVTNKIKGVISIGSFMFDFCPIEYEKAIGINFLIINGVRDDIVTIKEARSSYFGLNQIMISDRNNINIIEEPGLFHAFSQTSLQNVRVFLNNI